MTYTLTRLTGDLPAEGDQTVSTHASTDEAYDALRDACEQDEAEIRYGFTEQQLTGMRLRYAILDGADIVALHTITLAGDQPLTWILGDDPYTWGAARSRP